MWMSTHHYRSQNIPQLHIYRCYIKDRTAQECSWYNHIEVLHWVPGGVKRTAKTQTLVTSSIIQHKMEGMQKYNPKGLTVYKAFTSITINSNSHSLQLFTWFEMRRSHIFAPDPLQWHIAEMYIFFLMPQVHRIRLYQARSAGKSCIPRVSLVKPGASFIFLPETESHDMISVPLAKYSHSFKAVWTLGLAWQL